MIGGRNGILVPVTRPNAERLKWRRVKQFSNSRDHTRNLSELSSPLNDECAFVAPEIHPVCDETPFPFRLARWLERAEDAHR